MMKNSWYEIKSQNGIVEIDIYDEIGGWGIYAADFKRELDEIALKGGDIVLNLNSPGGDVFEGVAIYHAISRYRDRLSVTITGVAASIASVIALAGNRLVMPHGTFLMIHEPWTIVLGTAEVLRQRAKTLDQIRDEMVGIYQERSKLSREELLEAMAEETWYSPDEAFQAGFADAIEDYGDIAARSFDWRNYKYHRVPQPLWEARRRAVAPKTERELEESLVALGFSKKQAERISSQGYSALQGDPASAGSQGDPGAIAQGFRELAQLYSEGGSNGSGN
jgi:ATP-dependent protease ClpP protease subunit